jgi:nucleotide-binding universal stress UspA family protein
MYQVIVVGTDGSESAGVAVRQATALAKLTGATLHVVHAHQHLSASQAAIGATAGVVTVNTEAVNAGIADESAVICGRAAEDARRSGVNVETHTRPGDPADALITTAEDVGADLIVIGNRGMTGVKRFVLGSVPNKVSHHAPCNLLIVNTTAG